jgi:Ni/Fe-hydrogenase subunit HybB-like protein
VSSFLVGLNIALMVYSRNLSKICGHCQITNIMSNGILAILPAFFTSFSCGGGLLASVVGPAAFSSLALYSSYVAPITTAVLAAGIWVMSRKITQLKKIIIADECYFAQGSMMI